MPYYYQIDNTAPEGRRTATNLLRLREKLELEVPQRTINDTLLLATWNIREFDSSMYGKRTPESLHYIAEIASRFDLVAIQEVRENLKALDDLKHLLGWQWNYLVTDVTTGKRGNKERMAFLYDSRKVKFGGLAGELVLAPAWSKDKGYTPVLQFARTPFIVGFQVGWFKFMISTVHVLYGTATADDPRRIKEIQQLAGFLKKRATEEYSWADNLLTVGDFNIFSTDDETFQALTKKGFVIPEQLQNLPSNATRNKHYDQIAFLLKRKMDLTTIKAGVFDFFSVVYGDDDEKTYAPVIGEAYRKYTSGKKKGQSRNDKQKRAYYRAWRTFQMSDHLPMWVEIKIDFGKEYLQGKTQAG